jgi:hypothetical protein
LRSGRDGERVDPGALRFLYSGDEIRVEIKVAMKIDVV